MFFLIGLLIGLLLMYLIAGMIVYSAGNKVSRFFQDDKRTTITALLSWPSEVHRLARAGLIDGHELLPRPNLNRGGPAPSDEPDRAA